MNIGIDARLLERKITGIGRVLIMILKELTQIDNKNKYYLFSYDNIDTKGDFYTNIPTIKSFIPQKIYSPIWSNFVLPIFLKRNKIDLFFSVNQIIPLIKVKNIKYVSIVHDVICKADKKFLPFIYRRYLQVFNYFSIKSSDLIFSDSEYSKQDILKYYNVDEKKVIVMYPAADKEFKVLNLSEEEVKIIKNDLGLPEKIILYVGMIENRKNITGLLKIADIVYEKNKEIKFALVGKIGYGGKDLIKEVIKRKNVIHLKNVDDQLLKKLYNISSVFLFPSFYEGFGYPPLEAMQSGLPVLASNNTSLSEIIGPGGILHNPTDYNSFVSDMFKLMDDKTFYLEIQKKGLERAKDFNITSTVREIVNSFNELASKNKSYINS